MNYVIPLKENIKLYGEAAIGGNFSMVTKMGGYLNETNYGGSKDYDDKTTYTPALGFAFGLECGVFINEKFSIGLRYSNLGSYKYKYKHNREEIYQNGESIPSSDEGKYSKALSITNISICLGLLF